MATGPWDAPRWDAHLIEAGCEVVCGPSIDGAPVAVLTDASLADLCSGADAILASTRERITARVIDAAPALRIVAKATIGVEKIDLQAATGRGVLVVNSPAPENITGLAEATIGLMVALAKGLLEKEARIRGGRWRDQSTDGMLLAGWTIGIVGLGRVGTAVARRLAGWDVRLLTCDPYVPEQTARAVNAQHVALGELLDAADMVTLHVPLTRATTHLVAARQFARMRAGALLVNTSRGRVVDEAALLEALTSGHLAGAALDVFEEEPLPASSPLRGVSRNRLILTPHSIGSSRGSRTTGTRMAVDAILSALAGNVPPHVVNSGVLENWRRRWAE